MDQQETSERNDQSLDEAKNHFSSADLSKGNGTGRPHNPWPLVVASVAALSLVVGTVLLSFVWLGVGEEQSSAPEDLPNYMENYGGFGRTEEEYYNYKQETRFRELEQAKAVADLTDRQRVSEQP